MIPNGAVSYETMRSRKRGASPDQEHQGLVGGPTYTAQSRWRLCIREQLVLDFFKELVCLPCHDGAEGQETFLMMAHPQAGSRTLIQA